MPTRKATVREEIKRLSERFATQQVELDACVLCMHGRACSSVYPCKCWSSVRNGNEVAVRPGDERAVLAVLDAVHERTAHIAEVLLETLDISVAD